MSRSQNSPNQEAPNIFVANSIYPDAKGLLGIQVQPLESIKDSCLIVVDTNVLLLPYSIGRESLQRIGETYRQLVESEQLIVPGQVVREFAKNRAKKLAELFQQIARKSNISNLQKGKYPLLESVEEYQTIIELEQEVDAKLAEYRKAINRLKKYIQSWTWNDPVSVLYSELFKESVIYDPKFDHEIILKDLKHRQIHKIPPGYKDSSKDDNGVGDLLIWHTILKLGQERKDSILFVTGDEKADWYHQSEKQALYPRFELVDEFRRNSEGQSFHIVSFSELLDLFGASSDVVQEIHQREAQERLAQRNVFAHMPSIANEAYIVEQHVFDWLKRRFPNAEIEFSGTSGGRDLGVDLIVMDDENGLIGVEVKYFQQILRGAQPRLQRVTERFNQYAAVSGFDRLFLVLVASDFEDAVTLRRTVGAPKIASRLSSIDTVVGYITGAGEFEELSAA